MSVYQSLGECMLRLTGTLTRESEAGLADALYARVYRDRAIERKDPTCRAEYDRGWELGRWLKIDKRPRVDGLFSHDLARKLYDEFTSVPA